MSIKTELKKEGIEVIKALDTLSVITIAKNVATKLAMAFPEQNLNCNELFVKLSRLNMYIAKMPHTMACAKYYYKNSSIYFSDDIDFSNIDSYATHECIHYLQELRDTKNHLIHLGLCDFTNSKLPGMALNEAAVQLMSSKALDEKLDTVKYYDITLPTNSPYYYALECNLLNQMAYITGEYALFNSTLYSNDSFKRKFISLTSEKTFYKVQSNLDKLMTLEDNLSIEASKLGNSDLPIKTIGKIEKKISDIRNKISELFINTQNLILTAYFDNNFKSIYNLEQVDNYRRKLYNYKDLIGCTNNYTFFNDYYVKKMADLEQKCFAFENNIEVSLVPFKTDLISTFFTKLKKIFISNKVYEKEQTELY